jgi:hypothetical protein
MPEIGSDIECCRCVSPTFLQREGPLLAEPTPTGDGRTVTVRVPISIRRRGGRKLVLAPDGTNVTTAPVHRRIDNAMVKAIARAFRWRELLENAACQRRVPYILTARSSSIFCASSAASFFLR